MAWPASGRPTRQTQAAPPAGPRPVRTPSFRRLGVRRGRIACPGFIGPENILGGNAAKPQGGGTAPRLRPPLQPPASALKACPRPAAAARRPCVPASRPARPGSSAVTDARASAPIATQRMISSAVRWTAHADPRLGVDHADLGAGRCDPRFASRSRHSSRSSRPGHHPAAAHGVGVALRRPRPCSRPCGHLRGRPLHAPAAAPDRPAPSRPGPSPGRRPSRGGRGTLRSPGGCIGGRIACRPRGAAETSRVAIPPAVEKRDPVERALQDHRGGQPLSMTSSRLARLVPASISARFGGDGRQPLVPEGHRAAACTSPASARRPGSTGCAARPSRPCSSASRSPRRRRRARSPTARFRPKSFFWSFRRIV